MTCESHQLNVTRNVQKSTNQFVALMEEHIQMIATSRFKTVKSVEALQSQGGITVMMTECNHLFQRIKDVLVDVPLNMRLFVELIVRPIHLCAS